jgi:hypothetical protein
MHTSPIVDRSGDSRFTSDNVIGKWTKTDEIAAALIADVIETARLELRYNIDWENVISPFHTY